MCLRCCLTILALQMSKRRSLPMIRGLYLYLCIPLVVFLSEINASLYNYIVFSYLCMIFSHQFPAQNLLTIQLSIWQLWLLQSPPLSEPRDNQFSGSIHLRVLEFVLRLVQLFELETGSPPW